MTCAATSSGPTSHEGDAAALIKHMQAQGVHVYRFEHDVNTNGVREFGTGTVEPPRCCPRARSTCRSTSR